MKATRVTRRPTRMFVLVFQHGDEVISTLESFAREQRLTGSQFTAIGAFEAATLAYFDWQKKQYQKIPLSEQVEVLSLIGDISINDGTPKAHAHVVVGKRDGTAHGGHLLEARVRPTLELVLTESPAHLQRRHDPESGLALINLSAPGTTPRKTRSTAGRGKSRAAGWTRQPRAGVRRQRPTATTNR